MNLLIGLSQLHVFQQLPTPSCMLLILTYTSWILPLSPVTMLAIHTQVPHKYCPSLCSHNELASLPSTLTSLTNLQLLKLDHNQLKGLPVDLGSLVHLEEFDASHNLLSNLPPSLGDMKALQTLVITHNRLENIPELGSLTSKCPKGRKC